MTLHVAPGSRPYWGGESDSDNAQQDGEELEHAVGRGNGDMGMGLRGIFEEKPPAFILEQPDVRGVSHRVVCLLHFQFDHSRSRLGIEVRSLLAGRLFREHSVRAEVTSRRNKSTVSEEGRADRASVALGPR